MIPEQDMANVAGMGAASRRLVRLGVETVDLTVCDHGAGVEAVAAVRGVNHTFKVHGARDHLIALDQLCDEIAAFRRRGTILGPKDR